MDSPDQPRHILLATTGESPQVVTETLFAIHQEGRRWPDEIRVITTTLGRDRARKGLLEEGHLKRLCEEIGKPVPVFTESHIEVVPGADGRDVDDARSLEDHEALADFIMTRVRDLTALDERGNPVNTVHASLAGGRKTMTFYLGYAMSIFGRRQDSLSHVLISKGYESLPDFWYPSKHQGQLYGRDKQPLMPRDAEVTLAPIPFIRHRHDLPKILSQDGGSVKFRDLVRLINLGEKPDDLRLCIDLDAQTIIVSDAQGALSFTFKPGFLELSFYAVIARATLGNDTTLYRPSGSCAKAAGEILQEQVLRELVVLHEQPVSQTADGNLRTLDGLHKKSTLKALSQSLSDTWFDQRINKLKDLFKEQLTGQVSDWLTPGQIWDEGGKRLDQPGSVKGAGYGIPLAVSNITLIEAREKDLIR